MMHLRQSTASQAVLIGPFVDTDGAAVTGLTIDAADIRLSKNGGNIAGKNSGGGTHDELGMYTITFDATDTNTVGRLQLVCSESGALIVYHEYEVLEEATYDLLYAASALGYVANAPVNVAQVSGDSTAADNLELAFDDTAGAVSWLGIVDQGTMQAGSTATTAVLRAAASFADDVLIGATIHITGGTGIGQRRLVTDWVSATDTATVATWETTPDNTSVYKVYATAPGSGADGGDGSSFTAIPWNAAWDAEVQSEVADALGVYDPPTRAELTSDTNSVLTAVADVPTVAEFEARTLAAASYATAANLATVDTVVDAIKVQTDKFTNLPTFTEGGTGGQGYGAP